MLVSICLHGMTEEYRVFLENLSFCSFAKLMEAARSTNESVHRSSRLGTSARLGQAPIGLQMQKKGPIFSADDNIREAMPFGWKAATFERRERYPILPPFPCGAKRALLYQWVKDHVLPYLTLGDYLSEKTRRLPTIDQKSNARSSRASTRLLYTFH